MTAGAIETHAQCISGSNHLALFALGSLLLWLATLLLQSC